MASTHLLLLFVLTEITACVTPGPAVLTVTSHALSGSRAGAVGAIVGIGIGSAVWYCLAALGLVALIAAAPALFAALRWIGIAYLIWLGISLFRGSHGFSPRARREQASFRKGLWSAVVVQLTNPKALLFMTVFLPPFIDPRQPIVPQLLLLGAIGISIDAIVQGGYAAIGYRFGRMATSEKAVKRIDQVSGGLMIGAAAGLAAAAR